ncbi:hypothetical protein CCP1ISM_60046 [Azospirillaceae bacterium]
MIAWILGITVIAYFVFPGFSTMVNGIFSGGSGAPAPGPTTINTVNPYITVTAVDGQATGSAVAVSAQAAFDGGSYKSITLGSDTAVPGQTLAMLLTNNTQYHNKKVDAFTVATTSFPVTVLFNKNASVTENIFNTVGLVITTGGGAGATTENQTALGNGATYNWKDCMSGTALASTQDMVCIIEVSVGSNVSTTSGVTYDGKAPSSTSKPTWYTVAGTNSNVYLFDIPALASGAEVCRNIQLVNKATGSFPGGSHVVKTCYTKEYFKDPNSGAIVYDVADSNGLLKSMAHYTYDSYFE